MTEPTSRDRKTGGRLSAQETYQKWTDRKRDRYIDWCYVPIEKVKDNVFSTNYPREKLHFIRGDILETVPNDFHKQIAFLRLDTDWYQSTKHELDHLYDLVVLQGVVAIDDYGSWLGQRDAVDAFLKKRRIFPLLHRTQRKERVFVKTFENESG